LTLKAQCGPGGSADVTANVTTLCEWDLERNGPLLEGEFQIKVDIQSGDTANAAIEVIGYDFGVTFIEVSSGTWFSSPINEDTILSLRIRDTRCDTVIVADINRVCECEGWVNLSGDTSICNNGMAELTLTLGGIGPFDFELQRNGVVYNGSSRFGISYGGTQTNVPVLHSPTTVTISVPDSGTYTIEGLIDHGEGGCYGGEIGVAYVEFYTHPDGDIHLDPVTGENPICLEATTSVDIDITQGAIGPFTAYYTQNGNQTSGVTIGTGLGTIYVIADTGLIVLDSIVDVNECASGWVDESVMILFHDTLDVDTSIVCSDDPATPRPNDGFYIEVSSSAASIVGMLETSNNGVNFTNNGGVWTSSVTNENNSVDVQVSDVNGCGSVFLSDLHQRCSCHGASIQSGDLNLCKDSVGVLMAQDEGEGVVYKWSSFMTGEPIGEGLSLPILNEAGVYVLTTHFGGCPDQTATATVSVTEVAVVATVGGVEVSEGDSVDFGAFGNASSGLVCEWFDPSMNLISNQCVFSHQVQESGVYTVVGMYSGCVDQSLIGVQIVSALDEDVDSIESSVFPNPTSGLLELPFKTEFTVWRLSGELLQKGEGTSVDLSKLNSGVYLIQQGQYSFRVVKE
jgi:hypothetical protein